LVVAARRSSDSDSPRLAVVGGGPVKDAEVLAIRYDGEALVIRYEYDGAPFG
jgi:hypothetical protein